MLKIRLPRFKRWAVPDRSSRQRQIANPCLRCSEDLLLAASPESFRGQLIVAGAGGDEPIRLAPVPLLFGMRSLAGTMTGSSIDAEDTLSSPCNKSVR